MKKFLFLIFASLIFVSCSETKNLTSMQKGSKV
ncbi:MAG: hypothetical protein ACJAYY_002082, partial [Paraglaciecola sp.]